MKLTGVNKHFVVKMELRRNICADVAVHRMIVCECDYRDVIVAAQLSLQTDFSLTREWLPLFMWVIHEDHKSSSTVARDKIPVIYVIPGPLS